VTNKEAINIIGEAEFLTHNNADYAIGIYEAIEKAKEALEREEELRWHDLKKDPLDLPDAGHKVRLALDCATGRKNVIDGFIGYGDMEWYTMDVGYFRRERSDKDNRVHSAFTVIAWREIEPFEEVLA